MSNKEQKEIMANATPEHKAQTALIMRKIGIVSGLIAIVSFVGNILAGVMTLGELKSEFKHQMTEIVHLKASDSKQNDTLNAHNIQLNSLRSEQQYSRRSSTDVAVRWRKQGGTQ